VPTYTYKYLDDGQTFDVYQSFTEPDLTVSADGRPVRKVFSPIGVSFSGSGFYRNDSRSENKTTDAPGKKTASAESSGSSDSSTSSTPAAAPAAASAAAAPAKPAASTSAKPAA
jgi:predicted nucleic acid-binding Zn ribbon protein